jgi:hypothetical protein
LLFWRHKPVLFVGHSSARAYSGADYSNQTPLLGSLLTIIFFSLRVWGTKTEEFPKASFRDIILAAFSQCFLLLRSSIVAFAVSRLLTVQFIRLDATGGWDGYLYRLPMAINVAIGVESSTPSRRSSRCIPLTFRCR